MKTIIADVTARAYECGGLSWGLWHDVCLLLQPIGSPARLLVSVKEIDFYEFNIERDAHTVTFGFDEQELDAEWICVGTSFEVWFEYWHHVDISWQKDSPVADGVVTCIL